MASWKSIEVDSQGSSTILKLRKIPILKSGSKRKLQISENIESKKSRMDPIEMQQTIQEAIKQSADAYKSVMEDNNDKIVAAMDLKLAPLVSEVATLSNKYETLHTESIKQSKDMSSMRDSIREMKDTLKEEIVQELSSKSSPNNMSAYKYTLSVENEKVSCNLLVHGFKSAKPKEDIVNLLASLSIPTSVTYQINSVVKLGKDGGERNPSILVTFQNGFQRNEMLRFAKNLPKGVYFDRDIPVGYREAYKNMKRKAYKLRKFLPVTTQIIFAGHLLQLRYKDKEDGLSKGYTIEEEFFPTPESMANHIKGNISVGGAAPSTSVNATSLKLARETLILSGIGNVSNLSIDAILKKTLKKHEHDSILKIEVEKGSAIITCDSKTLCQQIYKNYNGKTIDGLKLNIDSFDI